MEDVEKKDGVAA